MKRSMGFVTVMAMLLVASILYADKGRGKGGKDRGRERPEAAAEQDEETEVVSIIIPEGTKSFEVSETDIVRLTGKGIAGSSATATITGPAKIEQQATIRRVVNGKPLVGAGDTEFDIEPTGQGPVTVTISVKFPNSDQPEVKTYSFTVK